jgi:hypothetical protein
VAFSLVIDALATYRLTRLVVEDEITADLRDLVWNKYPPEKTKVGYAITCPHCTSMYAALLVAAAPRRARPLVYALALAAITSLLHDARQAADVH